jgi:GxxExxY protein
MGNYAIRHGEVEPELNLLASQIIGAAIEVHKTLGPGLPEAIYKIAMCVEFAARNMVFDKEFHVPVTYKDVVVGKGIVDLWVDKKIIVELKAVSALHPVHEAQLVSYLKLTGCKLGLLINFNVQVLRLGIKRVINTK